jgi:hypothetical protein
MTATIRWDANEQAWKCDLGQGTVVIDSDKQVIEARLDYLKTPESSRREAVRDVAGAAQG